MSGGRNCVDSTIDISLWVSADGMGKTWEETSVSGAHNTLWSGPPGYLFSPQVNNSQGPIFAETNSYTNLLPLGPGEAVLLYLREWPKPGLVNGQPDMTLSFPEPTTGFAMRISSGQGPAPGPAPPGPAPSTPRGPGFPSAIHVMCGASHTKCPQFNEGNATSPKYIAAQCNVPPWTCPQLDAAQILSNYLGNMSKTQIPVVVNGTSSPPGDVLAVGHGAAMLLTSGRIGPQLAALNNDSFVISHNRSGIRPGSFVVTGALNSQRGDTYAAYELLRQMGCKFLAWDMTLEEELPSSPLPKRLPPLDMQFRPQLEYRDNNEWAAAGDTKRHHEYWAVAIGYNGPFLVASAKNCRHSTCNSGHS